MDTHKRSRKRLAVVDVMNTLDAIEGDGLTGWWENMLRFGDPNRDFNRVIESFRFAGLDELADIVQRTSYCRDIVAKAIENKAAQYEFSSEQEQELRRCERYLAEKTPDAQEALLRFIPHNPS